MCTTVQQLHHSRAQTQHSRAYVCLRVHMLWPPVKRCFGHCRAVGRGESGALYFGINVEFPGCTLGDSVSGTCECTCLVSGTSYSAAVGRTGSVRSKPCAVFWEARRFLSSRLPLRMYLTAHPAGCFLCLIRLYSTLPATLTSHVDIADPRPVQCVFPEALNLAPVLVEFSVQLLAQPLVRCSGHEYGAIVLTALVLVSNPLENHTCLIGNVQASDD